MLIYGMSLEKKIILGFLISAAIIAILALAGYVNFIEVRKEIRYLEMSDSIRSKTLQLRRHEKNFFLYGDIKEIEEVHTYLDDIKTILEQSRPRYRTEKMLSLEGKIEEYGQRFYRIETIVGEFQVEFTRLKPLYPQHAVFFPLVESTILERPLLNAELLKKVFLLQEGAPALASLRKLDTEITALRKDGEEILILSKDLDKSAREKVEKTIGMSQTAALVLFPLFLFVGLGTLFIISHNVVKRLKLLTTAIEKAGMGDFSSIALPPKQDEVGVLINTFNKMETDLIKRDEELLKKNEELLHSRKLASIGTLASGVAHELNNPLNNIYLAAQILAKETEQGNYPEIIQDTVKDIFSQTLRVKRIVSDLLEFAREKPPELKKLTISSVIHDVLNQIKGLGETSGITFDLNVPENIEINADRHLLEQVFINLFTNAIDAMDSRGTLTVDFNLSKDTIQIAVSDTGKGIADKDLQRIFDPFFTTKERGTGLGLAIVYRIIEKHHGKIKVESRMNKGTTFTITLPRG
jgi:two-component system NtrC family sensor kinase